MKKKEKVIIDTGIYINYFLKKDERYRKILQEIFTGEKEGISLFLNLTELYYVLGRLIGKESSMTAISLIRKSPIKFVNIDEDLSIRAGEIKLTYDFLSIVDAYLIALAEREKAKIITTDSAIPKAFKNAEVMS
ncbi:hypothetical protein SJAV_08850 [Sulfurisphaera javensis]|uniref:PIN domain-containing protein n=1 Tax=Sulfurisphaera javensis TaxID=2049879 RepID=A0AAT9GQ61_9CREN